ncbi:hypothetical protein PR001_g13862 [Phytophthora rubi]|uniref:PiggyBac transposable element-derived protein domain-containing protein n=1 Tax=Phytophthora rubi TaxID=129364 RepID=A0A6A3LN07_9STRA|nr:hypothetical protein PR001_g13862 [Phytophthora rubi]
MVAPTPKAPRYTLSEKERLLCREELLSDRHERRIRRAGQKDSAEGVATTKKASRKKAAKHTTPGMEIAESKGTEPSAATALRTITAEAKDTAAQVASDAKETADDEGAVEISTTDLQQTTGKQTTGKQTVGTSSSSQPRSSHVLEDVEAVISGMLATIAGDEAAVTPSQVSVAHGKTGSSKRKRRSADEGSSKRRRRILCEDASEGDVESSPIDGAAAEAQEEPTPAPDYLDLREEPEDQDEDGTDSWDGDWDIGALTDEDPEEEHDEFPDTLWASVARDSKAISAMKEQGWEYDRSRFGPDPEYADLYDGPYGPSASVLEIADDPLALLFYFMPPKLWRQIAVESNRYHDQSIPVRARAIRSQQRRNGGDVEELGVIRSRLAGVDDIEPWDVLRVMALLIGHMLAPIRKGIAVHWSTKRVGCLPANRFGLFMAKHRFFHIMGYFHLSNNKSPQAKIDRAWKIRPVVDVLQRTFARGYETPPIISFDEATLPSRSRYNPTRQFNKDKPHKWGTKVFVAACAKTAYCVRIEVYCGTKAHLRTPVPRDNNSGEAAVLRNMNVLCPPSPTSPWRLVITDRFYTSVKLSLELLHRRMYLTGTIQTDRAGYAKEVVTAKKTRTVNKRKVMVPPQGTTKIAQNKQFPQLTAAMWMDRNPVHMLSSGGSREPVTVMRRIHGNLQPIPALGLVRDYHRWMGGVDIHDQLRMQRYSVQLAYKTRKYYKTLFLGLVDMALVNAFIVHRLYRKQINKRHMKHYAFLEMLMEQLLAVDEDTFVEIEEATQAKERTAPSPGRTDSTQQGAVNAAATIFDDGHCPQENPDTVDCEHGVKRRHRSCKVCAIFKVKPRKFTKYYCPECSTGNRREKTCFQIWHEDWSNGNDIPRTLLMEHKIRMRPPSDRPGKKRKRATRGGGVQEDDNDDDSNGGQHQDDGVGAGGQEREDSDGEMADEEA